MIVIVTCYYAKIFLYLSSDIDECAENTDNCDQHCINTVGSFTCACNAGYRLALDFRSCDGKQLVTLPLEPCNKPKPVCL